MAYRVAVWFAVLTRIPNVYLEKNWVNWQKTSRFRHLPDSSLLRFKESRPSKSKWTAGFRRRSIWLKQSIVKWKVDMFDNWRTDRPAEWRVRVWGRCKTLLHGIEHNRDIWKWAIGSDGSKNIWCFLNKRDMHGRHPSSQHVRWHASNIGGKHGIFKGIPHGNRE